MSKKSKAELAELKRTNPKKYRRIKLLGYGVWALIAIFILSVAFGGEDDSAEPTAEKAVVAKEEKNSAALAMEEEAEPVEKEAEKVVAKKEEAPAEKRVVEKKEPADPYEEARKEAGGYLPQIELDDAISAATLRGDVTKAKVTADHVAIWASVETNLTAKMTYKSARMGAVEIYEMLSGLNGYKTATIIMSAPGTDAYGNDIDMEALKVTWTKETIDKVNYGQFDFNNLDAVSEFYSTTE